MGTRPPALIGPLDEPLDTSPLKRTGTGGAHGLSGVWDQILALAVVDEVVVPPQKSRDHGRD